MALPAPAATRHGVSDRYYWTEERMIAVLRKLNEAGIDLAPGTLKKNKSYCVEQLVRSVTGRPANGAAVQGRAHKMFGSYTAALRAAGIDPNAIRRNPVYDKKLLGGALLALREAGVDINPRNLLRDNSANSKAVLFAKTGLRISLRTLYHRILIITNYRYNGFLREIGIDPNEVIRKWDRGASIQSAEWMDDDRADKLATPRRQHI
jgi:hypothetical protein